MTEPEGHDSLVTLLDGHDVFIEKHPFLTVTGAALMGYILGRYAGDEILTTSMRAASGMITNQVEGLLNLAQRK